MRKFRNVMTGICSIIVCVSLCTVFVYADDEKNIVVNETQNEEQSDIAEEILNEEQSDVAEEDLVEEDPAVFDEILSEDESPALSEPLDEEISIDETTFPDENFRNLVLNDYDTDHSGSLSTEERSQVEWIVCDGKSISDLTGVCYFSDAIFLYCQQNSISELDLSQNMALEQVYCYGNQMTKLNLSGCPNLAVLSCSDNLYTSLDLSNNPKLKWIYCGDNPNLEILNVKNCSLVTTFHCFRCALKHLDISDCAELSLLYCFRNELEELDVSKNTELRFLSAGYNKISNMDVSKNTKLKTLGVQANNITTLDIRNNEQLITLYKTGTKSESEYEGKKYYVFEDTEKTNALGFDVDVELIFEEKDKVQDVFEDVKETDWFVSAVQYVYDNNLMAGKGQGIFAPNAPLRREEFTQILYNHMGKPEVIMENPFADVKDDWYKKSVLWAKENNIANGKEKDGKKVFDVGNNITREEVALMIYKYAKLRNYNLERTEGASEGFKDSDQVSPWAKEALEWAISQEIMSGKGAIGAPKSEMKLDPQGTSSRAECASMISKLLKKN